MRKLVLTLACVGLSAAMVNAATLRLYFSASDSLDDVPVEFTHEINAVVDVGRPAYLWARVEPGDIWCRLNLEFTGTAGDVTSGEMYNPDRWWDMISDLDPVGDNYVDCYSLYPIGMGLGDPSDWLSVAGHYLVGEVTFSASGAVYLQLGPAGIAHLYADPGDQVYFGFGDNPLYCDDYGSASDLPDLYVGGGPGAGACCLYDGECLLATAEACEAVWGGQWQGEGTSCDPNPCPWEGGACCFEGGSCEEMWDEYICLEEAGGVAWYPGEHCDANPCLGACCLPSGSCIDLTQEVECDQLGGEIWLRRVGCDANPCHPDTVFYVDDDAPPGGDGSTWAAAFGDLRDATDIALPGDEIRVAEGTYKPDRGTGDEWAAFELVGGLSVYGGYAGYGAPDPDERDPRLYEAVLSGDIGTPGVDWDNSRHVVMGSDAYGVIFDGFTVTGGYAFAEGSSGGGLYIANGEITVASCTFRHNGAGDRGGAIRFVYCDATLVNCRFINNSLPGEGYGGALSAYSSQVNAVNCLFAGNYGGCHGGGAIDSSDDDMTLVNCTLVGNQAVYQGGAIHCDPGTNVTLANSILWANTAPTDPQISGSATVTYSDVEGGWSGAGNIDADPRFVDVDGPDNDPNTFDDNDFRLAFGSPCIDAGDNTAVPPDTFDLDGDGDTTEPLPVDLDGNPRFVDDPATPDSGNGNPPIVDMGAYEFQGGAPIPGDLDGDGDVDLSDLAQLLAHYGMTEGATYEDGDLDGDGDVDLADLAALLAVYGTT